MSLEKDLEHPKKRRAGYKSRVTLELDQLEGLLDDQLTSELFERRQGSINVYLEKIEDINVQVLDLYIAHDVGDEDSRKVVEINSQGNYSISISDRLAAVAKRLNDKAKPSKTPDPRPNQSSVKLPQLECCKFDGQSEDKLAFKNFLQQFNNCIDACGQLSNSSKLTYLRSYLTGYAFRVVSHLSLSDDNYDQAIKLLKDEFLDEEFIVDETLKTLLSKSPKFDPSFADVRSYINDCRSMVHELKLYGVDLLEDGSAGCKLLSHIIYSKLPPSIRRELVHRVNTNYPTISHLFDNYGEIIKTLIRTSSAKKDISGEKKENTPKVKSENKSFKRNDQKASSVPKFNKPVATLENFSTSSNKESEGQGKRRFCKFCESQGHTMFSCNTYETYNSRVKRCAELSLCDLCSSTKHTASQCPGLSNKMSFPCINCKAKSHISALCPSRAATLNNICINTQHSQGSFQPLLLPVLTVTFRGVGNKTRKVRCLVDLGSQRSYLSEEVVRDLRGEEGMTPVSYDINTFLGSSNRDLKETCLSVNIPGGESLPLSILAESNLHQKLRVSQLDVAWNNLVSAGVRLAEPDLASGGEHFELRGIIGVDITQFFPEFKLVPCMQGSAWKVPGGLIPFGNILHFLHRDQKIPIEQYASRGSSCNNNFADIVNNVERDVSSTIVNFVLHPRKSYFSPLESLFSDSAVEQGLENMFSLDSVGCSDVHDQFSQHDLGLVDEFKKGIQFRDNRYYVNLPWKKDLVDQVPSNHKVALSVLHRVVADLDQKGLLPEYQKVFHSQCEDGIIERIEVKPENFKDFIWIPHRPVIKVEPNTTTKIRPVFNCSLKTNNKPSLNEAAFAGVNLMGDIVQLSLYFRSNKFAMLSDIKQAFLQIMLAKEEDRNRFCFFMKEGDQLVAYRYKTIIFGFNASPFILNYVLKHHANTFCQDEVSQMLHSNFYVDNLIVTGNSKEFLEQVYVDAFSRMNQGGFYLRSWNTNNEELRNTMRRDGNLVTHGNDYEKVLGYKYVVEDDTLRLSDSNLDSNADTKRGILSQVSKVFDPLGLFLPVTTKGKLIVRDLWIQKLDWDDSVPESSQAEWKKHCSDLTKLFTLNIQRSCVNQDSDNALCIFCDASKTCYGFAVYNICDGKSQLLFAKSKVAPLKAKTLPTLELLAVFLALKCLPFILDSFKFVKFNKIVCAVDSQIVLQWLLTGAISSKNVFTRNRLKDITMFRDNLMNDYGFTINFRHVRSEDNPSDLITRGLTFRELEKKLDFWHRGPSWLASSLDNWPLSNLGCLSEDSKLQVKSSNECTTVNVNIVDRPESLIDVSRFSDLNKLFRVAGFVFKAIFKFRGSSEDPFQTGKLHVIKEMQKESFFRELSYLLDPSSVDSVPSLVANLDLFLDDKGVIRSRGRIGRSNIFNYEVMNPILLAKDHHLTRLIVEFYHRRCKHLGIQTTLNAVRTGGFWVPKMRQCIKNVLNHCFTCKKFNNLALRYPKMTNLPKHRVIFIKPFMHTGVDFTGHLWVKNDSGDNEKMYILIFTCLNVRAVHIELVPDMSTHSFILAFLRFVNLYGVPSYVYSDNARSFIAGCQALEQALLCDEYKAHFQNYDIQHIRIPLYSAWVGATWERLIRTIKSCLYKTIGRARLTYFELLTVISDVQAAINSRPLTYRSSENDLEVITPSSFLKFHSNPHLMFKDEEEGYIWDREGPSQQSLEQTLASRDEAFAHFKDQWYQTYLLSLREHCRDLHQCNWQNKIKAGDVVLIKTPNKTRPYWMLGRVLELVVGHDNAVRSVKLRRGDGIIVHHSINHLYPLELSLTHACRDTSFNESNIPDEEVDVPPSPQDDDAQLEHDSVCEPAEVLVDNSSRPKRQAAAACQQKMRRWCTQLNK